MNKKYRKNIEKQKDIQEKIEELQLKQEMLKEEQEEMENIEVLKEYRSIDISIDEFLEMMRNYKKEEKLLLCHSDYYRLFSPSKTQFNLPATYKYLQTLKCMLHHSQASWQNLPNYQLEQQAYRYRFQLLQQCRQTIAHQNQLQAESLLADISLAYASTLDWRYPVSWQNLPAVGQGAYPYMQACFHLALSSKPNSVFWQSI